jgi:hypothetical protein
MVLWVVMPCSLERIQHFGGTYRLALQVRRVSQGDISPRRQVLSELHGVTTHKTHTLRCHRSENLKPNCCEERSSVNNESLSDSAAKQGRSL